MGVVGSKPTVTKGSIVYRLVRPAYNWKRPVRLWLEPSKNKKTHKNQKGPIVYRLVRPAYNWERPVRFWLGP